MQSQAQRSKCESFFVLPVKKQSAIRLPKTPLMTGALVLVIMLIMVFSALALGSWWDGLSSGDAYSLKGQ